MVIYLLASGEVSAAKSIVFAAAIVGGSEVAQEALPDPLPLQTSLLKARMIFLECVSTFGGAPKRSPRYPVA